MKFGRFFQLTTAIVVLASCAWGQTTLVSWSFESVTTTGTATTPAFTGSQVADGGALTTGSTFTGFHASASTWSNPAGNGSTHSFSSNTWAVGDYYQFQFATTGYTGISFTWDQTSSNTGPKYFKLQYSTDGSTFTDGWTPALGDSLRGNVLPNALWNTSTPSAIYTRTVDLSAITGINDQATVYIRLVADSATAVNGGIVATGGTDRVDNIMVAASGVLPVELSSITATSSGLSADVQWTTATEVNADRFDVQRSAVSSQQSAKDWVMVGSIAAHGSSNAMHQYSFSDNGLASGTYAYRLKQIDLDGSFKYSSIVNVEVGQAPKEFSLGQKYPNPFNPSTSIQFTVPSDGRASLKVFDMLGREVATLVDGEVKAGVYQQATFDASRFSSGIYFARLQFGQKQLLKKMVLAK